MVKRGVACRLNDEEIHSYDGPIHYIAHHAVLKPDSKNAPCHIVFNSSANYHGHVLNEYYAKGPDMLNNLLAVLLRFREERFAFIGDISKMLHSIKNLETDQMTHRFLWRDLDMKRETDIYVMTAVNFGDHPSAAIAIIALYKTAEMSREIFPKANQTMSNRYMDDIPESKPSKEEAEELMSNITKVLEKGGFRIKEWLISGHSKKWQLGENEDQHTVQLLTGAKTSDLETEKVLGMLWDPKEDKLLCTVGLHFSKFQRLTSRPHITAAFLLNETTDTLSG